MPSRKLESFFKDNTLSSIAAMEWSSPSNTLNDDGSPSLPTGIGDLVDIFTECHNLGMNVESHVIAKLAIRMIPRDQVIEIIKHMWNLNEENVHESTLNYFNKKYPCPHGGRSLLSQDEIDVMIQEFGKEKLIKTYQEKKKEGYCAVCGKVDNLLRCSRCKERQYCSVNCQKKDWKKHKKSCAQK